MAWLKIQGAGKMEHGNWIVQDVSFEQAPGERLAIAGESGSGKTTLLKMVGGHAQPDTGAVYFENKRVIGPLEQLLPGHPGIAYLSQHYELRNNYWVHEILEYANDMPAQEAALLYDICDIRHLLHRKTNDGLSGGEKQRIALARLLTTRPRLLLLDEPFSNLDAIHKSTIRKVIHDLGETLGITCLMVSHEAEDMLSWADKIIVMQHGKLVQQAAPTDIYYRPATAYVAGLFGEYNLLMKHHALEQFWQQKQWPADSMLFLRPEQLQVTDPVNSYWQGTVESIQFRGKYFALNVETEHQTLRIDTQLKSHQQGDAVGITIISNHSWFLPG